MRSLARDIEPHRRRETTALGGLGSAMVGLLALVACDFGTATAGGGAPTTEAQSRPIEIFSWWTRVGETDALGALVRTHKQRYPDDEITNASAELSGLARKTLRDRMWRAEPPDTFQANVGWDLMDWVLVNGLDARESRLEAVDAVLERAKVPVSAFPEAITRELSHDGKLYAIPANLHRINEVFYSTRLLREQGLSEPQTVADLIAAGETLRARGIPLLAVGSKEPWTLAVLALECVLVAEAGPRFYEDYFRGKLSPDEPEVRHALETTLELAAFMNADHASLSWIQAVTLVRHSRAAMTVMGDWARVVFEAEGSTIGKDFGEIPFPESATTFVFTSDVFTLPKNAPNRDGAGRLLETLLSREGQAAVQRSRHALPARLDVELEAADAVVRNRLHLMRSGQLVLAQSGMVPPRFADDVNAALAEMLEQRDIEPVLLTLKSRYALLR